MLLIDVMMSSTALVNMSIVLDMLAHRVASASCGGTRPVKPHANIPYNNTYRVYENSVE